MKIQNNNLKCPDSPYIAIMKPNTFFANKKVQTTYKEYEIVEDENSTIRFKDYKLFIPEAIQTLIREYCEMAETLYDINSFDRKAIINSSTCNGSNSSIHTWGVATRGQNTYCFNVCHTFISALYKS
mgnify:CR=1 FL=1